MKRKANPLRDLLIRYAYKQGYQYQEIAEAINSSVSAVSVSLRRAGGTTRHQGAQEGPCTGHWQEIAAKYRAGMTLEAIGFDYNVTRERIRQILKAQGITGSEGGRSVSCGLGVAEKQTRRDEMKERAEQRALRMFGCSLTEAMAISGGRPFRLIGTPTQDYKSQRRNAERRSIPFNLTLPEWWKIWQDSGKWELRGRGKGKYCMARIGDTGGYEVGNVEIIPFVQNSQDFYKHVDRRTRDELDLTPRERQVYDLLRVGLTTKAVGAQLEMKYPVAAQYVMQIRRRFPELRAAA